MEGMETMTSLNDFYQDKTILITGHTGFKGSWLALWLQELQANVIGYALEPPTSPNHYEVANIENKMISIINNINDYYTLSSTIQKYQPEIVFHLAAQALVLPSYEDPLETFQTNIMGTANVLEAVRKSDDVKVLIGVTSDKCYENTDDMRAFSEGDRLGGNDPYSSSKACAELVIHSYMKSFFNKSINESDPLVSSVRAGNVIGGGDWAKDRLIPDCIKALSNDQDIIIRSPTAIRPWQHVLDPLHGYLLLAKEMHNHGRDYAGAWNFGPSSGAEKPVSWIVDNLCRIWGGEKNWVVEDEENKMESKYLHLDSSKSQSQLNWIPKWDIDTSLQYCIEWYRDYYESPEKAKRKTIEQIRIFNE